MLRIINFRDRITKDMVVINTTSRSTNWSVGLSPFFLGPVELYGNYVAKNVENGWQYSKVYQQHTIDDEPIEEYWNWAMEGWKDNRAQRYPMGKGAKPLYSLWDGRKLNYIEARKEIYIPLYSKAVKETKAFQKLQEIYQENQNLYLLDFDGYDHKKLGMSYQEVMDCSDRKMGHAFVLGMMLENALNN